MQNLLHTRVYSRLQKIILFLAIFLLPTAALAQEANQPILYEFITVDLWPDYDRPELLVILNASLAPETPLPATITFPLPENATMNVVARVDSHNVLIDDLNYTINDNALVFTTPSLSFQVEYYQPYEENADQHDINFRWTAPLPIQLFLVTIQEPFEANDFTLSSEIMQVQQNSDNLRYHVLPAQVLEAGQEIAVNINYKLPDGSLSNIVAQPATADTDTAVSTSPNNWWLYVLGSALLVFSLFMIGSGIRDQLQTSRISKPSRQRGLTCTSCGQLVGKDDKFCGNCGAPL